MTTAAIYHPRYAVFAIIASVAALSLSDAIIKTASLALPLWQVYIFRSFLTLPVLYWLAKRNGAAGMSAPFWLTVRSVLLVVMWLSYYASLPLMPLSLAAAAYYTGPLFIVSLSALAARRWPSPRILVGITFGFAGVLLIIRPDASGFQLHTLLPVIAAFLYGVCMVLTSTKCRNDDPFVMALAVNVAFIIGGAGAAFAYQKGPPATVAVFDYAYLVFSLIWGVLFFGEVPGALALCGIGVIIAAGILALPARRKRLAP